MPLTELCNPLHYVCSSMQSETMKYQKTSTGATSSFRPVRMLRLHKVSGMAWHARYTNGFPVGLKVDGRCAPVALHLPSRVMAKYCWPATSSTIMSRSGGPPSAGLLLCQALLRGSAFIVDLAWSEAILSC